VFDIQQGVAIGLYVKSRKPFKDKEKRVYYADVWGLRDEKSFLCLLNFFYKDY